MAENTITSQLKIDGGIIPDFSFDWEIEFKGHKYIMPLRQPQGAKENTSFDAALDLTFRHWAEYQLTRWYFFTVAPENSGTVVPDKYFASVSLNLKEFCDLFGQVLSYYYGDKISIDRNPDWVYQEEATNIEISNSFIWDVLIKFYELFAVRWQIVPRADNDNTKPDGERYIIKVGYPAVEIDHIFRYGFEGGLLKVERQVQDDNIRNMIIGRGGDKNLPYRYFKKHDKENESFSPDPDWVPELANIPFTELRGATFRSYVQGWKAAHVDEYKSYVTNKDAYKKKYGHEYPEDEKWELTITDAENAYAPWAWMRGNTDRKFSAIEYVADEFDISSNGYGVVGGSSIDMYGGLMGGLDNNEEIYPTIQGVTVDGLGRIDQCVDVEKIDENETEEDVVNASTVTGAPKCRDTVVNVPPSSYKTFTLLSQGSFGVPAGEHADLDVSVVVLEVKQNGKKIDIVNNAEIKAGSQTITVINADTGEENSASGIPEGRWSYRVSLEVHNMSTNKTLNITVGDENPVLTSSKIVNGGSENGTWNIWVKNIWGSFQLPNETATQYAERVWQPILGDHVGNEAKIVFSDGMLSLSQDYEFPIVSIPAFDPSKILHEKDKNGNIIDSYPSHWRITLGKSDADLDALGVLLPSTTRFAVAGNHFFFIGIDMPHMYVVKAEERLDDYKKDELLKVKDANPTFVVSLDKVCIHNYGEAGALVEQLHPGDTFTLYDERFIPDSHQLPLVIQSITYNYNEPTDTEANLLPDVEIVLSDEYVSTANPVAQLSGEISAIQKQLGSISNIAQIVRNVGDKVYLRKDRYDRAAAPLDFMQGFDSYGESKLRDGIQFGPSFAEGSTGFGGKIDKFGNGWLGGLHLRDFLEVPELRYNRTEISIGNDWNAPGGGVIEQATPDFNANGSIANTGTITLHLEDGEIGAIAIDDICQGIFHDSVNINNNSIVDTDDGDGNFRFAGFASVYFTITDIADPGRNSILRYRLRPVSDKWPASIHPSAQMHFVCYGSFSKPERRTSRYSTRTYERYLTGVKDWEFTADNIAAQFGDLSNLSLFGIDMSGYSAYLNNIYMSGHIEQLDITPRVEFDYDNDNFIAEGDAKQIKYRVVQGGNDITDRYPRWNITRDSGDPQADAEWNSTHANRPPFPIAITSSEIGSNKNGTTFTFTAAEGIAGSIVLRHAPVDGKDGQQGIQGPPGVPGIQGPPGSQGEQGLQGCLYRATQWMSGYEYHNDAELETDSVRYIDIVLIPNPSLATKAKAFRCKLTHVSSGKNAPGTNDGGSYWEELNSMAPMFTPFLLADGALITLLQSNQVVVMKSDGSTVNVALGGGNYPLWIGATDPGEANFKVDDTGKAYMTGAEISGQVIAGDKDGQRVEIQPLAKAIKIYDESGNEVSSLEGIPYTELSKLFQSASGRFPILDRTKTEYGYAKGITLGRGMATIFGIGNEISFDHKIFNISEPVSSDAPVELLVSGYLYTEFTFRTFAPAVPDLSEAPADPTSPITPPLAAESHSSASISLYVDTYSDITLTRRLGSQLISSCSNEKGGIGFTQKRVKTTAGGVHVLRISYSVSASGTGVSATVKWGSAATGGYDISATYVSDFYVSRYFANGFCLGNSARNYIWAYRDGDKGMRFVMENNGYGFEISGSGIRHKHHDGNWMNMPMFVFKALYRCSADGKTYTATTATVKSFDGHTPAVTWVNVGKVRLTFPESWVTAFSPSVNNLVVNVVGYGVVLNGSSPVKANVAAITSTYIEITLSDDETYNDGGFMINISYM